ncbi:MAG: LuxR C-terminal-related transcriptional regulator [Haloechinothrix sp.]
MRLVTTKLLTPPARRDLVARPALERLLGGALTLPLTLVTAPAGFGKTSLVSGWLRRQSRVAWLMLDENDNVPGRFLDYLIAAIRHLDDRSGEAAQAMMAAGQQSASMPAVMATLVNDLADADQDAVLVLDDFHTITEPEILDAVGFLVEHCPPRLHLVLVGRQDPMLPLARWRGRGLVGEIGSAQLRFSHPEAAQLLRWVVGHSVENATVATLHRRAEGWAAGLQMLGIGLRGGASSDRVDVSAVQHGRGDSYVLDYLAEEVLRGQPEETRRFLRLTSVLDTLTPPLCDAVTERTDSAAVIRQLEQENLFLVPLDERGEWHRYHGLFADYLRTELDAAEATAVHAGAARWFAETGMADETIRHAVAAGDHDLAIRTVRESAEEQIRRGGLASLLSWLGRLPEGVVRQHADLAGFKGWLLYLGGRMDDAESYALISEALMADDAPESDRAMLRTFQAYLALTRGEPGRAAELATHALRLLGDSTSFFRAAAMGVLGQARRLTGDRRGAIEVLRAAVRLGQRSDNALSALEATGYLAPLLYVQGRLREAVVLCEQGLVGHQDSSGRTLPVAGLAEVPLGTLRYEQDELDLALRHLTEGIARCEQLGTTSYTLLGLRTLARLHAAKGATEEAFRALLTARSQAEAAEDHRRARLVVATIAELHLRTGSTNAANNVLAEIAGDEPSSSDYEQLTRARLLIAQGDPARALDVLAEIESRAAAEGRDGSLIAILAVGARARADLGDPSVARELLAKAVELAAPEGYRRTFLDEGPTLVPLLRQVRATAPAFVNDLLARSATVPRHQEQRRKTGVRTVEGIGVVESLTDTQRRILLLIATGMSNQQVAEQLCITVGTTKWHLNQIFGRLQARNRTEAVARAREFDLL